MNERAALELSNNRKALLRRLKDAVTVLTPEWKKRMKGATFDFQNRCLVSVKGDYVLQWKLRERPGEPPSSGNQQTNCGTVVLIEVDRKE